MWEPTGTFSPDCLESLTLDLCLWGSPPVWSLAHQTWRQVWLRFLKAISPEASLLSTMIACPSLFTWVSLGIFLRLFKNSSDSHYKGFCYPFVFSAFLSFPHIPYHDRLS